MKAFKIDVEKKLIEQIDLGEHYEEINKHIGSEIFACPYVMEYNDTLYCDDEGLLKEVKGFFLLDGYPQPLAGNGLIVGCDDEGNSVDAHIDITELNKRVKFMDLNDAYNWSLAQSYNFN
jgi:hypothetical protein